MLNRIIQEQKMEALETMASAITHDFNNILTTITYSIELAIGDIPKESIVYTDLARALTTGIEAVTYMSEMLSFCNPTKQGLKKLNIAKVFEKAISFLKKDLPDNISIDQTIKSDHNIGIADPDQLQQIINSLVSNSVSSLEKKGGMIKIVVENALFNLSENSNDNPPIPCLKLRVSDNGPGFPKEIEHKLFDPFFTTKPKGAGKGLGLSTVYGFVKNHNGYIDIYSIPNKKTVFDIFFPVFNDEFVKI